MKIIEKGKILKSTRKLFMVIGRKLMCPNCNTIFKLEKQDVDKVKSGMDGPLLVGTYYVKCPICKERCYFVRG